MKETVNKHTKGHTWTDKGVLWDYKIRLMGQLPMNGCIRAKTKKEAQEFLNNRFPEALELWVEKDTGRWRTC